MQKGRIHPSVTQEAELSGYIALWVMEERNKTGDIAGSAVLIPIEFNSVMLLFIT